jgi:restriction system protein
LQRTKKQISVAILRQFPEFVAFLSPKDSGKGALVVEGDDVKAEPTTATPEEAIQQAENEIISSLRVAILDRIRELSPTFFERLVVDLIVAMGYGGSKESVVQKLTKSADEGIDGIVNEDALGLDAVYLQAKRYAADNTVGRELSQQFAGALVGQSASKGVFVTTSSFSKNALEFVRKIPQKIVLIDGEELTRLMVQYGVGVRIERTVNIKRIDPDYFDDGEE